MIEESPTTHLLAELGVVFLLFEIGLHFSLAQIWEARRDILGLGPLQVGLCTIAFAALALTAFELELAVVNGATLALSSTAMVVQTLAEHGKQHCPVGVTATSVLIFQDICAIFLLILAVSIGDPQTSLGLAVGAAALKAAIPFLAAIFVRRYLVTPVLTLLAKARSEEVFTATALLIVLVTAATTGALELSLGAFLAGMIISETPYRYLIQTEIKPFRGLLLSFFLLRSECRSARRCCCGIGPGSWSARSYSSSSRPCSSSCRHSLCKCHYAPPSSSALCCSRAASSPS